MTPAQSLDDSAGTRPIPSTEVPEGEILLPTFYDRVKTLAQTVEVDYYMPGCPPVVDQVGAVFGALLEGKIPERGATIGVEGKTNCDVCTRNKASTGTRVKEFKRPHLIEARSRRLLPGAGSDLLRSGHAGGLWVALHQWQHALPGLLRPTRGRRRPGRQAAERHRGHHRC